jgi:cytoskeletal protein RodZ
MRAIQTKKNKRSTIVVILVLIIIVAAGITAAIFVYKQQIKESPSPQQPASSGRQENNSNSSTANGQSSDTEQKQQAADDEAKNTSNGTTSPSGPSFSDSNISFTADASNNLLVITTKLQAFSGTGTCTLELKNGDLSVTESAQVIYQEEYSSCAGFSIPLSKLSKNGTWSLKISVTTPSGTFSKIGTYVR